MLLSQDYCGFGPLGWAYDTHCTTCGCARDGRSQVEYLFSDYSPLAQRYLGDRHSSGTTLDQSELPQPPDLQSLSLKSPDNSPQSGADKKVQAGSPEFSETVPAARSVRDQLRLEDDGDEEDEGSSRALTPTSSDETATTSLPNLVARDQASPQTNTPQSDWESVVFPEISAIDEVHLVELSNDVLESVFQDWLRYGTNQAAGGEEAACGDSSPSSSSNSSSDLPNKGQQPLKRKHPEKDGEEDNEDRRKCRRAGMRPRGKHPLHRMLACHFCKRDPRRHRECCNFGGAKISYVKQHIYRKHSVDVYCPRCMEQFDGVSRRDQHTRLGACQLRDVILRPDGITSEQREWLSRRMSPSTSEEQRWYTVWDYLFPETSRPPSPFNNFDLSEDLFEFSDFITSPRGHDILLQNLRRNSAWTEEYEAIFGPDLTSALGQFFARWAATRDGIGDQMEGDRDQGLAIGHEPPAVPEEPQPTEPDASPATTAAEVDGSESENTEPDAVPPQGLGAMDGAYVQQANPTEDHANQTIQEGRAELHASVNAVPAPHYGMGQMEPIPSLEIVLDRARESRTEDWRLELDAHEELERKEDETAQSPLQLTESGVDQAGPSDQNLDVATQGFEFLDFGSSSDVLAESSLIDWDNIDFESLAPEGWDGDYWSVE